ncbi:hypothetical protein BXU09_20120 [Deinococcus sp. LM3]|nr:hypothetical protein BXU09_20120 [Deinococcus sp. LM3]
MEIYEAADGKLLVFGYYGEYFGVIRLLSNGSIDTFI